MAGNGEEARNSKGRGKAKLGRTTGRGQEFERERGGATRGDNGAAPGKIKGGGEAI